MIGALLFYTGLTVALGGAAFLIKPLAFLGIHTRPQGGVILAAGLLLSIVALLSPATKKTVLAPRTKLDVFFPVFQFNERHSARVQAPCDRVYAAVKGVKADEILFFRALTSIRRFGRSGPENILNPPEQPPLLDVATRTSFLLLSEEPGREIVVGTIVLAPHDKRFRSHLSPEQFRDLDAPGFAKGTMNFLFESESENACLLTTETRVYATDASARRRFAAYWRVIYPGSALIRRMWLRAAKLRAEAGTSLH